MENRTLKRKGRWDEDDDEDEDAWSEFVRSFARMRTGIPLFFVARFSRARFRRVRFRRARIPQAASSHVQAAR